MQPSRNAPVEAPHGRCLGELTRGDVTWTVYLDTRPETRGPGVKHGTIHGRLHFADGGEQLRSTGWIFAEWSDADILHRFNQFSAAELWLLLESLA